MSTDHLDPRMIRTMLLEKHGKSVSLRDVCDMLEGNPMIDDATRAEQVADMIASHLKDAK